MIQAIKIQALYRGWCTRRLLSVAESYFERYHMEIELKIMQVFPSYECKAINTLMRRLGPKYTTCSMIHIDVYYLFVFYLSIYICMFIYAPIHIHLHMNTYTYMLMKISFLDSFVRLDFIDGLPLFGYLEKAKSIEKEHWDENQIGINLFGEIEVEAGRNLSADLDIVDSKQIPTVPDKLLNEMYEDIDYKVPIADCVIDKIDINDNIIVASKNLTVEDPFEHHEEFSSDTKRMPTATLGILKSEAIWLENAIRERIHVRKIYHLLTK